MSVVSEHATAVRSATRPWRIGTGAVLVALAVASVPAGERLRSGLLATMICVAVVWFALEIRARPGRSPAAWILAAALAALVALPALLLAADPGSLVDPGAPLSDALLLHTVGVLALIAGWAMAAGRGGGSADAAATPVAQPGPSRIRIAVAIAVPVVSLIAFMAAVGGPTEYFGNLDRTGELTAGLTYLIWGVLGAKYAALALAARRWAAGLPAGLPVLAALVLALLAIAVVGARLLVMVAVLQICVAWLVTHPSARTPARPALAVVAVLGLTFVGLGELRRWQGLETGRSFPTYFVEQGIPNFRLTYVNQYADAVRLASLARDVVPGQTSYEYGREFLRIALQPIPGPIRPQVERAEPLRAAFTGDEGNANALTLPVVGYLQFGLIGVLAFAATVGAAAGWIDARLRRRATPPLLLALCAAAVCLAMIFRGSLVNAVAFMGMDVIGFYVAARFLR